MSVEVLRLAFIYFIWRRSPDVCASTTTSFYLFYLAAFARCLWKYYDWLLFILSGGVRQMSVEVLRLAFIYFIWRRSPDVCASTTTSFYLFYLAAFARCLWKYYD